MSIGRSTVELTDLNIVMQICRQCDMQRRNAMCNGRLQEIL
jgi:hypothetical protein